MMSALLVIAVCAVLISSFVDGLAKGTANPDTFEWRHHNNSEIPQVLKNVVSKCPDISRLYALTETSVRGVPLWAIEISDNPGVHEICNICGVFCS
ncbi:hypothetical protein Avbf_15236 [Armadillidium vulgare]|nr:hypothetical protein Avbf_15236 [Armadillidium vulgare]